MSLNAAAKHLADYGRHGDTTLVHMNSDKVPGSQLLAQAHGTSMTINPHTGLPEAFSLKSLAPIAAGLALDAFVPGLGEVAGLGLSNAATAGLLVGGGTALATGDLNKGLMAGLGAYGGAGLGGAAQGAGAAELGKQSVEEGVKQQLSNEALQQKVTEDMAKTSGLDRIIAGATHPGAMVDAAGGASGLAKYGGATLMASGALDPSKPKAQIGGATEGYIRPKYYDYRTQTYYDLPAVKSKDWGNQNIGDYINSQVATPVSAANGGLLGAAAHFADGGYTSYTPEQINNYFAQNPTVDVAAAIKEFNADPNAVSAARAGSNAGIASAAPAAAAPVDTNANINNWFQAHPNVTYQDMTAAKQQYGVNDSDILNAYDKFGYSAADKNITMNKDWSNAKGQTGYQGLNDNITSWIAQYPEATKADALQAMMDSGLNEKDVIRATGKTLAQLFDEKKAIVKASPTFVPPSGDGGVSGPRTTPATYAPTGTTNPYGNATNPGDLTLNADGSRTVQPNIPGRPYGGFTGMDQVRNAYTQGGGNLGQTLKPTKTYQNTGASADAYKYLFGEGAWPTHTQTQPTYANTAANTTQKYIWKGNMLVLNPDYVDPTKAAAVAAPVTKTDVQNAANDGGGSANGGLMAAYADGGISVGSRPDPNIDGMNQGSPDVSFQPTVGRFAAGGEAHYNLGSYSDGGRLLKGPGDGVSDSIPATIGRGQPARLADGEFVIPARIVSEIGNGSTDAGARKLYAMMDRVQKARGQTVGKGKVAKNTRADKYLPK